MLVVLLISVFLLAVGCVEKTADTPADSKESPDEADLSDALDELDDLDSLDSSDVDFSEVENIE